MNGPAGATTIACVSSSVTFTVAVRVIAIGEVSVSATLFASTVSSSCTAVIVTACGTAKFPALNVSVVGATEAAAPFAEAIVTVV